MLSYTFVSDDIILTNNPRRLKMTDIFIFWQMLLVTVLNEDSPSRQTPAFNSRQLLSNFEADYI